MSSQSKVGINFIERQNEERKIVAAVAPDGSWSGKDLVVERVKAILEKKDLDPTDPDNTEKVLLLFSGSYFWASKQEDENA